MPTFCHNFIGDTEVSAKTKKVMAGPNRQPCEVCGKSVKAEYCFCYVCGQVLCDEHFKLHLTSDEPLMPV